MGKQLSSSGTVRRMRLRKFLLFVLACNLLLLCALLLFYYSPAINVNVYIDNYFVNGKLHSSSAFTVVEHPGQKPHVMDLILRRPDAANLQHPNPNLKSAHVPHPHPHPIPLALNWAQGQAQPQAKTPEAQAASEPGLAGGPVQSPRQQQKAPARSPAKTVISGSETWAIELELQIK